jgi:tetratricopeptide (TPR) repeat protein
MKKIDDIRDQNSGITAEQEAWFHQCMVSGKQTEAVAWAGTMGDLERWTDRRGRTVAARLLNVLGDDRGSALRHLRNFRQYPDDPVAIFYGAFSVNGQFGALATLDLLTAKLEQAGNRSREDRDYAGLWAYLGVMQGYFRDFSRAHESLKLAKGLDPDDLWIEVQRSLILLREDRAEESREVAEAALARTPNYWPVIGTLVDRYWAENRDNEAMELLHRAMTDNQGAGPPRKLAMCLDEVEAWEEGLVVLDEFERRSTRADQETRRWLAGFRASLLYQLGRGEEMLPHAETANISFYHQVAERVKDGSFDQGLRVRLDVKFVRQNEKTCAPATLSALSQFFGRPADHLEVAEEICYDGTPDYKERLWAEQQGWVVREFRADWDSTRRLIDAGFPFALATVEPTSAHLQAVIGYDSRAGTVIIRDPGQRHYQESLQKPFFEDYAHCGPRAMVFAPLEKEADLREIELLDETEHDLIYRLNGALERHDREDAQANLEALEALEALAPDHRLLDHGRLILSYYDGDSRAGYEAAKRMLERYPESLRWDYACYRRRVAHMTREQRLEFLQQKVRSKKVFTIYYKELADVLSEDARALPEARYYYRRAVRFRGGDAEVYYGLAGVLWTQRLFDRATFLYRLAASLEGKDEGNAEAYFKACRWVRETEPALSMLRERVSRLGTASSGPSMTLCRALRSLDREPEMVEVLEDALRIRPNDGELIAFAANHFASIRGMDRARALVEQSVGRISFTARLRLTAKLAELDSKPQEALDAWRAVLLREPLAMDAHRGIAQLLARMTGANADSISHLESACAEFPYHVPLHEMLIGWLRDEEPGRAEPVLRHLLENHASNAWAWRELALDLGDQQRFDEGLAAAAQAAELQPEVTWSHSVLGCLHEHRRNRDAAALAFRRALELDVENGAAMSGLVRVSDGGDAKREALRFIEENLTKQVLFGDALHGFRNTAFRILEPDELLAALRRANEARPDIWETWSALSDQLVAMERFDEALEYAEQFTKRFPMMPRAWLDLAEVLQHRGERDRQIEALERCLSLNPQWTRPLRELADALENRGDHIAAVELLKRAVLESPHEAANHGCLADLLWKTGRREEAFEALLRSARVDPDYDWGWNTLAEWAGLLDRENSAISEGERLVEMLPMRWVSWRRLANLHGAFGKAEERIATLGRGLERLPHSEDLRQLKAWALCVAGRYEAALAECREDLWPDGQRPRILAGREAWIENECGRQAEAIRKMTLVAERHPDYYWAHERLTEWHQRDERWDDALKQARHLVRLAPTEPTSHGMIADLHLKRGDKEAAKLAFEKALQLCPSYAFAGYHLTVIHLEAKRHEEAQRSLKLLDYHHSDSPSTWELHCRLDLCRGNLTSARESFLKVCQMPDLAKPLLERLESAFADCGKAEDLLPLYREAMQSGTVRSEAVARRWVNRELGRFGAARHVERSLLEQRVKGEAAEGAWQELIYELDSQNKHSSAQALIRRRREIFRGSTKLWASAAYVLKQAGKLREVVRWMADYREREGVEPWMLINLGFAMLNLHGIKCAGPVHLYAATELPEDHDTWCHHAGAAYYKISCGRVAEARIHLNKAQLAELTRIYQFICRLAEYLIVLSEEGRADGTIFRRAVEVFPEWAGNRSARKYFFHAARQAPGALLFRSGAGGFAFGQWLRAILRVPDF